MENKERGIGRVVIAPPVKGVCPVCAVNHDPAMPHNRDSLYYQMRFQQKHGRFPTWADAMTHCSDHVKAIWVGLLAEHGASVEDAARLEARLETRPEDSEDGP